MALRISQDDTHTRDTGGVFPPWQAVHCVDEQSAKGGDVNLFEKILDKMMVMIEKMNSQAEERVLSVILNFYREVELP
ncbi:hypothetical protein CSB45_07490 [candidate division KSB3 bacterium]|uniref:Uncharacterized protein n=1 Tax=candidate division KSB3 bacterium TaxID=2044937 RepID=A0A2G6E5J6_9BACT|nr:MAG: hypothetical protein CSB45_07490 [candidate division KSB3 bacterium]PIE29878.1 MAG: hypothetical protein CSA57_06195 [candidate division KSB3 bacterium]